MAIEELSNVDPDMIMKLMKEDQTFMYRLDLVKDKIRTNLNDYADSIADVEFGMFDDEELDEIEVAKGSIMDSWRRLEERLNVNIADSLDFSPDDIQTDGTIAQEKDSAAGVFEKGTPSFILESFGDSAIDQIKGILGSDGGRKDINGINSGGGGVAKATSKSMLLSLMTGVMGKMGIKLPPWLTTITKNAGAAAPIAMLIGGIVWAAVDGIGGFMKSGEWGVSKISGLMGGILGGVDSGFKGSMKGMGKWALIGAGIGSVVPVVGTLLGGLIGAVVGGIMGWIGGERISKAFDTIGVWFSEKWAELTVGFQDGIVQGIGYFWANLNAKYIKFWIGLGEKIAGFFSTDNMNELGEIIPEFLSDLKGIIGNWFKGIFANIKQTGKDFFSGAKKGVDAEFNKEQSKLAIESRTMGAPAIQAPEANADVEAYKAELEKANVMAMENAKRQEMKDKRGNEIQEQQLAILAQIAEKPVGGGGGSANIKFDQGEIREATTDAAYNMRKQYYMRGI